MSIHIHWVVTLLSENVYVFDVRTLLKWCFSQLYIGWIFIILGLTIKLWFLWEKFRKDYIALLKLAIKKDYFLSSSEAKWQPELETNSTLIKEYVVSWGVKKHFFPPQQ